MTTDPYPHAPPSGSPTRGRELLEQLTQPGVAPQDIGDREATHMRGFLNDSLYFFSWFIMGYRDITPDLHGVLCQYIQHWGKVRIARPGHLEPFLVPKPDLKPGDTTLDDYSRLMTQIPREFFKTSVGTIANALWNITREPHLPVGIVNETDDKPKEWTSTIKRIAEGSDLFQYIYRDLLPPGVHKDDPRNTPKGHPWSSAGLNFEGLRLAETENSISGTSVGGATTGHHWPKLIFDDLIGFKHARSPAEMDATRAFIKQHIFIMRPAENGLCYINCTPYTYHDIYTDLTKDYGYKLYRRSALETPDGRPDIVTGTSIFPTKLSTDKLKGMHKRDPVTFWAQMQCMPRPGAETSFDASWLRHCNVNPDDEEPMVEIEPASYSPAIGREVDTEGVELEAPPRTFPLGMLELGLFMDPAPSEAAKKRQDPYARNGLVMIGVDAWRRRHILETWADRVDPKDVIDQGFTMCARWNCHRWFIEEVAFSMIYRHWINALQETGAEYEHIFVQVIPMKTENTRKDTRIVSMIPTFRNGYYYINRFHPGGKEGPPPGNIWNLAFVQELLEYDNGLTVDTIDAAAYNEKHLRPPLSPHEQSLVHHSQRRRLDNVDPITGY